jgi:hypothetical protein
MTRDDTPRSSAKAERLLRGTLLLLVFWDAVLAVAAIGFPHQILELGRFEPQTEPLWTRGVGRSEERPCCLPYHSSLPWR